MASRRGDPRQLGRGVQDSGHPLQGHAQVARGVPPLLLGHQPPVVVPQGDVPRLPGRVPRAIRHASRVPPRGMRWSVAAVWGMFVTAGRGMWHATQSSPCPRACRSADGKAQPLLFVARQAALAVVGGLGRRRRQPVRVVARDAAELALARAETATRFHLLDLPDRLELASVAVLPEEDRQEPVQRQARAEVEKLTARPGEAERALEMALLTDRFPQCGGQIGRVDDRQVGLGRRPTPLHVQLAGAVAALAADGVALEDRRLVAVQRPGHGANWLVWQNRQSGWIGRSKFGLRAGLPVAGGDVPAPLLGEPRDRRLEEETIALDQEGDAARPRAESEADFGLDLGEHASRPRRVASPCGTCRPSRRSTVYCTPCDSNGSPAAASVGGPSPASADRRQRSAHRVRAVGHGDLAVAPGAGRVADVRDPRAQRSGTASRRTRRARGGDLPNSSAGGT